MSELILVADIGGTNARFAIAEAGPKSISIRRVEVIRAAEFKTARDAVGAYLNLVGEKPRRACFAAAAPILGDVVDFTNSPWRLAKDEIKMAFGLDEFLIINDFYALAAGVAHLSDDDLLTVKTGIGVATAPTLVIGPGTGFGQALIVPTHSGSKIVATEGGHVAFAPRTDEETKVMKFIARDHARVSVERLLSGQGLVSIYRALCSHANSPAILLQARDISAAPVSEHPIAGHAVKMFCRILGGVVGDAVLSTGARGGVVLGGGILPKIREIFLASEFVERFCDKGRMQDYVVAVPVRMIIKEGAALYGAAVAMKEFGK